MAEFGRFFKDKDILVTGGLGFIGSSIATQLASLGANITIVDSLINTCGGNLYNVEGIKDTIEIEFSDLRDFDKMKIAVKNKAIIFNLAGSISHLDSTNSPLNDMRLNCQSHLSLLEACRISNPELKIVYASTRQIYGRAAYLPVDETHPLHPIDINGINKLACEQYHLFYHQNHNIRATALRLTNTYGPRMSMRDDRQSFISWWIRQLIENNEIKVFGDGTQIRSLNYIDDVVNAFLIAAANETTNGMTYNLGSKHPIALKNLAQMLIDVYKGGIFDLIPFPKDREQIDIGSIHTSYDKINKALGWEEETPLRKGLARTIQYYTKYKSKYW